ncbi:hypothetical protein GGG16DRAFT_106941 [Schizophyllum commune]
MCPASLPRRRELVPRPGRERTAAFTDVDIDLDDAKTKLRSSLTMNRPARHSPRRYGCATLPHASSSSSGSDWSTGCYFSDASKTHGQREALPCNQLDFGMSLRLRFLLSLSMMRMRLMVLPSSFGSCDGCENAGRGVSSAPFDANHRFQVLFLRREPACCDVRFGVSSAHLELRFARIGTPASFLIACGCELEVLDFELVMGLGGCTHLCSWPNSDRHKPARCSTRFGASSTQHEPSVARIGAMSSTSRRGDLRFEGSSTSNLT